MTDILDRIAAVLFDEPSLAFDQAPLPVIVDVDDSPDAMRWNPNDTTSVACIYCGRVDDLGICCTWTREHFQEH